ncbi:MAG TPA: hypothetical protein VER96_09345 [Polyangiaceae bacterium]|nr:hypothetical protein [Polyangiaceae bacterium]
MTSRLTRPASSSDRSRAARGFAIALLGVSGELLATTALGQAASGLTLRWQAPAGCPQQAAVRERIRTLTGATRAAPTALQAEGTITQTDAGHFHLKLVTRSGRLVGERSLDASSCENLTGAAAVSLALLMRSAEPLSESELAGTPADGTTTNPATGTGSAAATSTATQPAKPAATSTAASSGNTEQTTNPGQTSSPSQSSNATGSATAARKPSQGESTAATDDASEVPPSEIIERPIREPPHKRHALAQIPLAVMSFGPLPKPSWGVAFAGGASLDNWRLLLGGTAWLRQSVPSEQSADFGADIDRLTGTFRACRALGESKFEVSPCLVLSLEHITARGTGVGVTGHSERATWLAVGAGAQGRLNLTRFLALLVGLDAQIETARPVISVEGAGTVKQLGYAAFTATVGPEWIL